MNALTNDEKTILMIAASGQAMIPIGRWEKPVKALVAKGYMRPHCHPGDPTGHFNNYITDAGRQALEHAGSDDFKELIEVAGDFQHTQRKLAAHAEKIAQNLVDLSRESSQVNADPPHKALEKWSRVILERALAVLTSAQIDG